MSASAKIFVLDSIMEVGMLMSVEAAHVHTVPNTCLGNHGRNGDFIARSLVNVKCHWQGLGLEWAALLPWGGFSG